MKEQFFFQLQKRLIFLGYRPFEIKRMVEEATGSYQAEESNSHWYVQAIETLQQYEKLGSQYLETFSK